MTTQRSSLRDPGDVGGAANHLLLVLAVVLLAPISLAATVWVLLRTRQEASLMDAAQILAAIVAAVRGRPTTRRGPPWGPDVGPGSGPTRGWRRFAPLPWRRQPPVRRRFGADVGEPP